MPVSSKRFLPTAAAVLALTALPLAACGGDDGGNDTTAAQDTAAATTTETPTATEPKTTTATADAAGKEVFTSNCGSCHTLAAAGTSGAVGPNLDDLKPDEATVQAKVTNGGGGMPAFGGQLSEDQIQAVSAYVASVAGQ